MKNKISSLDIELKVINENIFNLSDLYGKYDIILEYTCFCAIKPADRDKYIYTMNKLLKNSGKFIGLLFPIKETKNKIGPPFLININETKKSFSKYFKIVNLEKSNFSIDQRKDNEVFVEMIKNA